ncbi:MAG: hypothetical protein HRT88_20220, partial [Lentisphaeraceae bacterium]|nr:hypothetical protein [Lentisphaeraceae bacterium]
MVIFNQRAAAFCWNKQGECFGVLICRDGQNFKVLAHWTQTVNNIEAVAAALQQGYKQMALIDNDIVVAGEMGLRCCFADTEVPPLNTRDLYSSLQFSLANHFPVDSTELNWGYRILTSDHKASPLPVRLVALKTALWNEWLGNIGTLKVDQLISPAAVADAV